MADDSTKIIRIIVDSSRAVDGSRAATAALERMEKAQGSAASSLDRMEASMNKLGKMFLGHLGAQAIMNMVDAFTSFTNALKVAGAEGANLQAVQDRLFSAANKNGVGIQALGQLYSRASMAAGELGASQEKLLEFVDGVTAALRVQGGSTEAAKGALLQLSQALSSGTVRAEEFNSILEGAFPIAQAAARGMDGMGGSVAKLRTEVIAGSVSSQKFFEGLLKGFGDTKNQAAGMSLTIGASLTANQNAWTRLIGTLDKATGLSGLFAEQIAHSTERLDGLTKSIEAGSSEMQPLIRFIETSKRELEMLSTALDKLNKWGQSSSISDWLQSAIGDRIDDFNVAAVKASASFIEAFRTLPDALGKLFTDGFNAAIDATEKGINKISKAVAEAMPWLGLGGGGVDLGRLSGGGFDLGQHQANVYTAGQAAASQMRTLQNEERDRRERQKIIAMQAQLEQDENRARTGGSLLVGNTPPGAAAPGKGGSGDVDRYKQLEQQLVNTAAAQKTMTEAALAGGQAFDKAKATVDAQNKVLEIFKTQLDENDPRLVRIRDLLLDISRGKAAEAFALATTEINKQNEVLEAENRLIGASNEQRAVELALIKSRQDAEKAGIAVTAEMQEQRRAAVETNERLKAQGEELKKANELWTAPLKSALESIQRSGADMWEQLLENGKFSAEEFGQIFAKMARRAAAELLALATIRPVINVAVQGLGSLGLVSPGTASALGYGSSTGSFGGIGGLGGGGMFGGSSGLFSPTFMQQPIFGGIDAEIANWSTYGTAAQNSLAPTTWGQAFGVGGGLLSMGMGAMNLFNARGNTGKTLGGIAGLLGGGLGIAGALMPAALGGMLGPIGMAVGLLGGLLPGLFGGGQETPPMPPLTYGQGTIWANGTGFDYSGGGMNGGSSMSAGAASIGQSLQSLFSRGGLKAISGSLIGGDIASGVNNVWSNGGWQGQNYTQIGLHTPTGYERVTYNDTSRTAEQAADLLIAEMWKANVLRGGVSGVSDSLKTATQTANPTTAKAVQDLVDFVKIYDQLGKTGNATADALKAVDEKFAQLSESATRYGLSVDPIDRAKEDEKKKIATDFADSVERAWKQLKSPGELALKDLEKERDALMKTNQEILDAKIGGVDQSLTIEKIYWEKRNQISQQMSLASDWNAQGNAAFQRLQAQKKLNEDMAVYNQDTDLMSASPMQRTIVGWGREAGATMQSAEAQFGFGSQEYMQVSAAAARRYSLQIKQASDDFIEGLKAMVLELESPGAANMAQLMKQRAADIATATALDGPYFDGLFAVGENVKQAMDAWNKKIFKVADDFRYSISQGLLAFTDPLQAQLNDLHKQRDEALATANANNDAVRKINSEYASRAMKLDYIASNNQRNIEYIKAGAETAKRALTEVEEKRIAALSSEAEAARAAYDAVSVEIGKLGYHYVSINDVTELFLKKEQQLREQYYAQALSGLEDLIKRITIGDLSGASSLTVLNGTQASYEAIRAQAFAGDVTARQNFAQTAGEYLTAGRDYYAYSPAYFAIRDQIKADIETLTAQVKGGTTGGSAVSPDVQAVTQQLERALADNDNLKRTVEQLLAKQDRTNDLLERLAANSLR